MKQVDYVFDSSCLIKLNREQPVDLYPSVWHQVETLTETGRAVLPREARREIDAKDDVLKAWVKDRPGIVCEETAADLAVVALISAAHSSWVRGKKNAADPFVIAAAVRLGATVVTDERWAGRGSDDSNLRIPNIAVEHGVECIDFTVLVRREQWRF